jgi:hypothetical protein
MNKWGPRQSSVTQTNTDKDEMEEVVDEEETVEDVGEGEGGFSPICLP